MPRAPLVLLYVLALVAAVWVGPGVPVYWDSFGYVIQAVTGRVGGLLLGRPLFILASHALVTGARALGMSAWSAEPVLRNAWLLVAALGAPFTALLARTLGGTPRAAVLAGACVALSPAAAHTSDAVLTDAPSMAVTVLAFVLAVRAAETPRGGLARAVAAGLALGVAAGLREQAVAHAVTFVLLLPVLPRGARVRFAVATLGATALAFAAPVLFVLATQPGYLATVRAWSLAMARERAAHAWGPRDAGMYLAWLASLGPVALAGAVMCFAGPSRRAFAVGTAAFAVCAPSVVELVLLAGYQDIAFSPRYLLAAVPGALALPAGLALDRWASTRRRALWVGAGLLMPALAAGPLLRMRERPLVDALRALPRMLRGIPSNSAVVTGQLCPAVVYIRALAHAEPAGRMGGGTAPDWQQVCPGWRWPDDLARALDDARAAGRPVVLDVRPASWVGVRQQRARREVEGYVRGHEGGAGVVVWR